MILSTTSVNITQLPFFIIKLPPLLSPFKRGLLLKLYIYLPFIWSNKVFYLQAFYYICMEDGGVFSQFDVGGNFNQRNRKNLKQINK